MFFMASQYHSSIEHLARDARDVSSKAGVTGSDRARTPHGARLQPDAATT